MKAQLRALAESAVVTTTAEYIEHEINILETRLGIKSQQYLYTDRYDGIEEPHAAQRLAALKCYHHLYYENRVWVHLSAPMQSGKTGVMVTIARKAMFQGVLGATTPQRVFVFTGMSDNDWRKQTKGRFPIHIRANVFHRSGVKSICESLRRMRGEGYLQNILLFVDESHVASQSGHTPRDIYTTLNELCPRELWAKNNIRIVTVSATDPAKVVTIRESDDGIPCKAVQLRVTEGYQSIESLVASGRMLPIRGNAHMLEAIAAMRPVLEAFTRPLYHIVRAAHRKSDDTQVALSAAFPDAAFQFYDAETRASARDEGSSSDLLDINTMLGMPPTRHTFIIIKNAFYAAKTINDTNVGIFYDRQTDNDAAILQGLAGRACGYGKSKQTIVFTVESAVERYLKTWREMFLRARAADAAVQDGGYHRPAASMNLEVVGGHLVPTRHEVNPLAADIATDRAALAAAAPARGTEEVLEVRTETFPVGESTIHEAVARVSEWIRTAPGLHECVRATKFDGRTVRAIEGHRNADGKYETTLGGDFRVRTIAEVRASHRNLQVKDFQVRSTNDHAARLNPCYDGENLCLVLRYLTGNTVRR